MNKNYIPTINISSLIKNNFETQNAFKTIKEIEKACVNVGFFQITGHGINLKEIKKTCEVGNKFFNLPDSKKRKLSPKKWNKKNKNLYRGYFPNDVNGKEGLDIGDLKVTKKYSSKIKNQYIEYLNLRKSFDKSIMFFSKIKFRPIYGKQFLKYDTRGRLDLDFNASNTGSFYELANITSVYWFLPNTDKWSVKKSIELKKI